VFKLARHYVQHSFIATALAFYAATSAAQQYPTKPIRVIVPFGPGGPSDFLIRNIGQKLTEAWGQQMIVDHRLGANGVVGAELTARAAPGERFRANHALWLCAVFADCASLAAGAWR
jgi:tripartite-type tricarboxylate transporter receptor subunit TctC